MSKDSYQYLREEGAAEAPLLFLFHGTGSNEQRLIDLGREVLPQATLIAPRGDVSEHGALRFFRRTGEGVYDMDDLRRATEKMARFVSAHVEEAASRRVLGLGYSNGANILASVVFDQPGLFDATVLMHPLIPFVPRITDSLAHRHILITAGEADPLCPPDLVLRLQSWLKAAGGEVETLWHEGGHEMRPGEMEAAARFLARHGKREKETSA